jgi:hypothetical protein
MHEEEECLLVKLGFFHYDSLKIIQHCFADPVDATMRFKGHQAAPLPVVVCERHFLRAGESWATAARLASV